MCRVVHVAGVCDSGWRGVDCGELDLLPVSNLDGAYQTKVLHSTLSLPSLSPETMRTVFRTYIVSIFF